MNAGAACASGDVLLFLHADTRLPHEADQMICGELQHSGRTWGRFDVQFSGGALPLIAAAMNLRSRLTGIATGDQAMFVTRTVFEKVGGFREIPLMEDIALSKKLKRLSRPLCLRAKVTTSARRWQTRGIVRTVMLMWRLRLAYYFGATPDRLARLYGYAPVES
jgi:rSAM/selenodomain-associated transferase 2